MPEAFIGANRTGRWTHGPAARGWEKRYGNPEVSQFRSAELIADEWRLRAACTTCRYAAPIRSTCSPPRCPPPTTR